MDDTTDVTTGPHFDGETYDPTTDHKRLTGQLKRVWDVLFAGGWYTVEEIQDVTGDPQTSIGSRIRDLRKSRFGGFQVESRKRGGHGNLWEWRLVLADDEPPTAEAVAP